MRTKLIIFTKIPAGSESTQVLFAIAGQAFPLVSLTKNSLHKLVQQYGLKRHENFDRYINKDAFRCFLLEWPASLKITTGPETLEIFKENFRFQWLVFPQAVRLLKDGADKNFLQLAVQYLSNDDIDDSIIAADFDLEFIKKLQEKSKDGKQNK